MALYNRVDSRILKEQMRSSTESRVTISFYKYNHIADAEALRDDLYQRWERLNVLGRTFVAAEGINAQISVPEENLELFKNDLFQIPFLNGVRLNVAVDDNG